MQKVTVKDIKIREGIKNEKPWKLVIIIGDDGSEFTTFDAGAAEVGIGGVIELDPVIKAGKTNFTKFQILQKSSPSSGNGGIQASMTPEMWVEKDRIERWSIEAQTIFKGAIELAKLEKRTPQMDGVIVASFDWAIDHFATKLITPKPTSATKLKKDTSSLQAMTFADAGKLKTACQDELKMSATQISKETAGFNLLTEEGRKEAWVAVLAVYTSNKDNPEKLFD